MPSQPDPVIDERYEELAALVRASKPRASVELRERVRVLAESEPERRTVRRHLGWRPAFVLAPAVLVAIAVGAAAVGLSGSGVTTDGGPVARQNLDERVESESAEKGTPEIGATDATRLQGGADAAQPSTALPPGRTRAQDYRAELRVFVRDLEGLASATARAMRATRSLGGFIVRADYSAPAGKEGDSVLVVRVPVRRVQEAILRFSALGTIVGQRISIEDLQSTLERQSEAIAALRRTIATLERDLEQPNLTDEQRAELRLRLVRARESLTQRTTSREATAQRAATARIALTLTTREQIEPVVPDKPGYFERTVRDAASALSKLLAWALAGLIVAGPFLVLAAIAIALERGRRRRGTQRLLERA
jgi:Domain of unknown function (DUF4349)